MGVSTSLTSTFLTASAGTGGDLQTTAMTISKRLVASGVVVVSQVALTEFIKKVIKKFS